MSDIPNRTRIYVGLLLVAASTILVGTLASEGISWSHNDLLVGVLLISMITLVERYRIDFPNRSFHFSVSVGAILSLGAAFTLTPLQAAAVVIGATLVVDLAARLRPIQVTVNAANLALATFLASVTYRVASGHAASPLDDFRSLAATIAASAIYTVVNLGILSVIVSPVTGETPFEMWKANFSGTFVFVSLPMLGSLVPITAHEKWWGILILAVPLAGSHLALRTLKKVELETQATIVSLTDALEFRDAYTHHHSARVTEYVEAILEEMPHLPTRLKLMTIEAARIHDVGKVGIKDTALLKAGPLTDEERNDMQRHSAIGADIVGNLEMYRHGASVVRHHHERWDGKGYPDGLKADEIPLGARIIAVADSFDAMTSDRPYRRALTFSTALAEINRNAGLQFDPHIVEAFVRAMTKPYPAPAVAPAASTAPAD